MTIVTVNEKRSSVLELSFFDENGQPVDPSSGSYRIDDEASDTEIVGDTPFTPSGSTHELKITSAQNVMVDPTKPYEQRLVTVLWNYGVDGAGSDEYRYRVKNLKKIS